MRRATRMTRCGLPVLLLVSMLGAIGCREQPAGEPDVVRDLVERGPLRFSVEAHPKEVRLGDPIEIRLHMHTPDDYVVQLPTAEDLTDLKARVVDEPDARPAPEGGLDWRRTFVVERLESGSFEIPPLVAKYARKPAEPDAEPLALSLADPDAEPDALSDAEPDALSDAEPDALSLALSEVLGE